MALLDPLYRQIVFGIARTLLAGLAGRGLMASNDVENYAGAIALLAVGFWSVYEKWTQHAKATAAP